MKAKNMKEKKTHIVEIWSFSGPCLCSFNSFNAEGVQIDNEPEQMQIP